MQYIYSRWDGTQQISPFDPQDLLEAMADDLMSDGDLRRSLRRLMQNGGENRFGDRIMGMQDLLEKLRQRRRQQLDRYDLGSIIDDIKEKLDQVKKLEREGIDKRLADAKDGRPLAGESGDSEPKGEQDGQSAKPLEPVDNPFGESSKSPEHGESEDDEQRASTSGGKSSRGSKGASSGKGSTPGQASNPASGEPDADALRQMLENIANRKLEYLDNLPEDVGGQIKALSEYEFMDPEAREKFQELLSMLQQQVMNQMFKGMKQALQNMTPQDLAAIREMLKDLNQMLRDRAEGKQPNFQDFMEKHGQYFPPGMQNLDELMEHLAQQMSQMQSLMQSMAPEMRSQLQDMMSALMDDEQLRQEIGELAALMDYLMPGRIQPQRYPFRGDESLTLDEAMRMMEQLQDLDGLEHDLKGVRDYSDLDRLDENKIRDLLGDEEAQSLEEMKRLTDTLEEAGLIERRNGKFELTPRAIRKIGDKALHDIFSTLKRNGFGQHDVHELRGATGERLDETKRYEFGDPFLMNIQQTVMNGVMRGGSGSPVRLESDDFEVYRTELNTQSATVLLLDMSRSMLLRGCFLAAKKVAMALHSLIKSQFPKDQLLIVGFSYLGRELKPESLPSLSWEEYEYGTNLQHGLMLAREFLNKQKGSNKQIIVITDGEPTAHVEAGRVQFAYPPTFRTIQETLREVRRCTRDQVTINTFMLETGDYLMDFVDQMTKINKGRAFFATPDKLGEYILVDYVANKRKRIA